MPSKQFIDSVNERVVADTIGDYKRWLKQGEHNYRFQASYGNGGRTPKCRKGQHDWFIYLVFSDNSKEGIISYGY
jgi:hypothetical protein